VADPELSADANHSRRRFLKVTGGLGAAALFAFIAESSFKTKTTNQIKKIIIKLPTPNKKLPAIPADPAKSISGLSKLITPNSDFFRIDTAIGTPDIDVASWRLEISGMVKNPITLSYDELIKRPLFELDNTISCVSNPVGGPLISNARWTGVRLDDLIKEAAPIDKADQILSSSDDGFSAGFPLSILDGRDAMIAIGMNGEVLPAENGYPARLIVPGLYGYVSATKWVTKIEITRFADKRGYWIDRGWSVLAPVKMESRIDTPLAPVKPGLTKIAGVAWAPNVGIGKVELRIDEGAWTPTILGPELSNSTWRQWWFDWNATSGTHVLTVRAVDKNGQIQSEIREDVLPNGAQGLHSVTLRI